MQIFGAIITFIGIALLILGCVFSVQKMRKLQDFKFKSQKPTEYKKLQSSITAYIFVGSGILAFIIGFICLNFVK